MGEIRNSLQASQEAKDAAAVQQEISPPTSAQLYDQAAQQRQQADESGNTAAIQAFLPGQTGGAVINLGRNLGGRLQSYATERKAAEAAQKESQPQPQIPRAPGSNRDLQGNLIITPEQAAEHLLRLERMKREKEAYVNRLIRSQ